MRTTATGNIAEAKQVGALLAERARAKGISQVVFDRGAYLYHGRIKALGDVELLDQEPRNGLAGEIAFLHPRSCGGVLVELIEARGGPSDLVHITRCSGAGRRPDRTRHRHVPGDDAAADIR